MPARAADQGQIHGVGRHPVSLQRSRSGVVERLLNRGVGFVGGIKITNYTYAQHFLIVTLRRRAGLKPAPTGNAAGRWKKPGTAYMFR